MTDVKDLGPLTYNVPITDDSGRPSPEFQRRWNTQRNNNDLIIAVTGTPVTGELVQFSGPKSVTNGDLSGDITTSGTLVTTLKTVNANVGSFGDGLHVATFTVNAKGLTTAAANIAIPNFTSITAGLAPASGGGTTNFLRADGTWAVAGSGTVTNTAGSLTSGQLIVGNGSADIKVGDLSGDVSTSGSGVTTIGALKVTTGMIQASAVTLAKIASAAASSKLVGSGASGSGAAYTEITLGTNLSMSGTTLNASGTAGFGVPLFAQSISGSVNFKNNPTPATIIQPVTVTTTASASARTYLVTVYYQTSSSGGSQPAIEIILDSTSQPAGGQRLQPLIDSNYGFGFLGGYTAYISIPGDSATHVIGLGCAQFGGGTGFTVTTSFSQIIAQQIG